MAQINKPTDYFDISTWTATTNAISNLNFSPDWVWIKSTDSGNGHILFDTIRGANIRLSSAVTTGEATVSDELMSFDSNGYTLGSSGNTNDTNPFNASYVGWSWRGSDSSAVSNTDGSITSTVSANTTSGFSIGTYSANATAGATVGHGLGVAPDMLIVKVRNSTNNWAVYHKSMGETKAMYLGQTSAETTDGWLNNTAPDSSVFTLSGGNYGNASGYNLVFYAFAEKKGFSKFGSYTGNGNSDGVFIYLGFKPAWFMVKRTDSAGGWVMFDNKRNSFNVMDETLLANVSDAETVYATQIFDFVSNGLKVRGTANSSNASGATYIYMAFAESPLVGTNNIPAVAR